MASTNYEAQRNANSAVAVWTVHLHFPAYGALPAKDFYWATADGIELEDGNTYERQLTAYPKGRHQRDRGNDYCEFSVANPGHSLYQEVYPYEDIIERCEVVVRECFEIETDYYESEIRFVGYLKDFTLADTELSMQFTALSDMSRLNFFVGNRILTRERCGTEFNFDGLNDPETHPCGWTTAQGGNPDFCSKFLNGVDGCKAHNNSHRFYAVTGLTTATVEVIQGNIDPNGFPYDSGPCFTRRMFMLMDREMNVLPMDKIEIGMTHVSFDPFKDGELVMSQIRERYPHKTDHFWKADFGDALFEVAKEHLFYIGGQSFAPVGFLGERQAIGIDNTQNAVRRDLLSIEKVSGDDIFYEFRTSTSGYIVTDENKQFFAFVHNYKPPPADNPIMF